MHIDCRLDVHIDAVRAECLQVFEQTWDKNSEERLTGAYRIVPITLWKSHEPQYLWSGKKIWDSIRIVLFYASFQGIIVRMWILY